MDYHYLKATKNNAMKTSECIHEFTGSIVKEETLKTLSKVGMDKTVIFEVEDAYPGYYGLEDQEMRPNFIYIPTLINYSYEEVKRIEDNIKKYCKENFDLSSASIDIYNELIPAIRIKYLLNYDKLKDIQMFLREEGVIFLSKKKKIHKCVLLKTDKVFSVKEMENGIYLDQEEKEITYITIPKHLKWKEFETITFQVKNNWSGNGFDAASAHFNRQDGIVDIVRIYSKENNFAFSRTIQEVYHRFIK
jgi:hypothetical protein